MGNSERPTRIQRKRLEIHSRSEMEPLPMTWEDAIPGEPWVCRKKKGARTLHIMARCGRTLREVESKHNTTTYVEYQGDYTPLYPLAGFGDKLTESSTKHPIYTKWEDVPEGVVVAEWTGRRLVHWEGTIGYANGRGWGWDFVSVTMDEYPYAPSSPVYASVGIKITSATWQFREPDSIPQCL